MNNNNNKSAMSSTNATAAGYTTNPVVKYLRKPVPCNVCGRPSFYTYYGVRCCEGCKQFFRRVVINKKKYGCTTDGHGICLMEKGKRCLGCRLDRCLLAGMRPRIMNLPPTDMEWRPFIQQMEARRRQLYEQNGKVYTEFNRDDDNDNGENMAASENDNEQWMETIDTSQMEQIMIRDAWNDEQQSGAGHCHQQQQQSEVALLNAPVLCSAEDWHKLDLLLLCERRQRANWDGWTVAPPWIAHFESPEQLLHFPGNFLTASKYGMFNMTRKFQKFTSIWRTTSEISNFICIDMLSTIEWARTMPVFVELELDDQLILLKHIHDPFVGLFNSFYSWQSNAETWTRANGHVFFSPWTFDALWEDEKLRFLGKQYLCSGVEALRQTQIGREEFALLLGVICCHSNAPGLSAAGRELLYNQSADYSRILLKFLQQTNGLIAGARKYADCMRLLEVMFCTQRRYEMFVVYRDMYKTLRGMQFAHTECPKALSMFSPFSEN